MISRIKILFIFLYVLTFNLQAQNEIILESPELVEARVGEGVVFLVKYNKLGNPDLNLTWKSDILDANFDDQEGEFYWETGGQDIGLHSAFFYLKDSLDDIVASSKTLIKVSSRESVPSIELEPDSLDSRAFIKLLQGELYKLEFIASTTNTRSADDVILTYIWNNNTDLTTIDQAETHVIGNRLLLDWTPSQSQASKKYFDLDLIAIDNTNAVNRRKYRFQIIGQELPPRLRNNVNDTYIITADQELDIDFSVYDPNNDPVVYSVDIPVTVGVPTINENGIFTWKLSSMEMSNISSIFPLKVKLKAEEAENAEHYVEKEITILKSERNDPPLITKLSNLSIREGYDIKRRVFIQDNNHPLPELKYSLENEPDWLYVQQEGDRLFLMSDTLDFDIVKADGIPVQFDVLFTVTDPEGATDSKFFTVTVNEGVNTHELYTELVEYQRSTDALLVGLRKQIRELDSRVQRNQRVKKGLLFTTFFLGSFSATGSFFDDHTIANEAIPYAGALLAITSSVNALAFNQEGKTINLKGRLEDVEKSLVRNKSYLDTYSIEDENDDELRNSELVNRVQSYRQALIEQRIELRRLEDEYRELNYVQRRIRKFNRKGNPDKMKWSFIDKI
ncbi:Ig-like domain-containing protein [Marivirga sp.]|uniref:Ig-like domain-containing protein n=1 Tax=Marivirga sp. TaxID=2018662 RepID=UPI002D7F2C4F|nr:Ig-like domain-containing protein [Marivirga sp.]HET8859165.1 Ig-like domain-containing protein [Marivirga sp.]